MSKNSTFTVHGEALGWALGELLLTVIGDAVTLESESGGMFRLACEFRFTLNLLKGVMSVAGNMLSASVHSFETKVCTQLELVGQGSTGICISRNS